jgi:hypothetical protein
MWRDVNITSTLRYEGLRCILPYRTADDRIEGVVLTFLVIRRERAPRMSQPDAGSRGTLR